MTRSKNWRWSSIAWFKLQFSVICYRKLSFLHPFNLLQFFHPVFVFFLPSSFNFSQHFLLLSLLSVDLYLYTISYFTDHIFLLLENHVKIWRRELDKERRKERRGERWSMEKDGKGRRNRKDLPTSSVESMIGFNFGSSSLHFSIH